MSVNTSPSTSGMLHEPSRRLMLSTLASLAGVALAGCATREPWRIGFIGGLSGRVADLGVAGRNGLQLAVDDLNAAGGVLGRKLELLAKDDEQNPDVARARMLEFAAAKVPLVIGPMTSSMAVVTVPIANQQGIVMISPTVTTDELSGRDDHFFRAVPNASSSGAQEADCLHRQGARRLVTVADLSNRAYTESWAAGARRRFAELGGELAEPLQFEAVKGLNYDDLTSRILKSSGDAVMLIASAADSAMLVQQLRRRSDKRFLAVAAWAGTEQFLQMGGGAVEGVVVPQYFDRESKAPTYQRFADNYRARFAEAPGFPAMNAYDAMMFGALALQQQKPGMALLAATRQLRSLAGLQRPVLIDEFGDGAAPLYLTRVVDKRFVPVDPS